MTVDPKFTKKVDSLLILQTESNELKTVFSGIDDSNNVDKSLVFTLCDRDDLSSKKGNYFMSFNLPTVTSDFSTASTRFFVPFTFVFQVSSLFSSQGLIFVKAAA